MSITEIPAAGLTELPLDAIRPSEDNPRGSLGDLTDLANSIAATGVWQPVVVTPREDDAGRFHLLVIGHRRHAAAVKAGLATIPAIVREMDEPTRLAAMFIENAQREDLTPIEEARSLKALIDLGIKQREVAKKVGKSQSHISKRLALLDLPDEVQAEVDAGRLVVGDAVELARLGDEKAIREIFKTARYTDPGTGTVRYLNVAGRVADVLEKKERDKQVRRLTGRLRAEGVTVVDYPRGGGFTSATTGIRLGDGFGRVSVSPEEHASEPCHAAAVSPHGEVIYVCTDPDRHPMAGEPEPGGTPDVDDPTTDEGEPAEAEALPTDPKEMAKHRESVEWEAWAEWQRRERERERAELDAAAAHRDAFITDLLRRKPTNIITAYVLTAFLAYAGVSQRAAGWLGIEGETPVEWEKSLEEFTRQSLANLTRAALAAVLEDTEAHVRNLGFAAFLDTDIRDHYAFLTANGYQPTDIEQRGLATIEPADDEHPDSGAEPGDGDEAGDDGPVNEQSDDEDPVRADDLDGGSAA